jgi:gamma-glutamyltranspeptidase/glutathione hydrolase
MKRDGGIITRADLVAYRPVVREPLTGAYRGYTIQTMPLPSSGGIVLIGMLRALEGDDVAAMGHNSAAFIHRFVEIANRYYADRAWFLGDPDFVKAPVLGLASRAYAAAVRAGIDKPRATRRRARSRTATAPGCGARARRARSRVRTTHFCVVDRSGNAVANTYTLNESFGSRYVVEGAGFLLNDEMDDFSIKPGVPNVYGLVGGTANAIAPGKRMLSSMAPTIVTRDGKLFLVIGSPGGSRIITSICEAMINVIDHGMNVADAVGAPRFHSQWLPDRVDIEPFGFPRDVVTALEARGHKVDDTYGWWGQVHAIQLDGQRSLLLGAADPRAADAKAAGY